MKRYNAKGLTPQIEAFAEELRKLEREKEE
jgi:hypothetical protein